MMTLNTYIENIEGQKINQERYNHFKTNLEKNKFLLQDDYFKLYIFNSKMEMVQKLSIMHTENAITIYR